MVYNNIAYICQSLNIFVRERKISIKEKINCCIRIWAGASQGSIVKALYAEGVKITKQAVSKWMQKWQEVTNWINTVPRRARKKIAMDEVKIKINGKWAFLWVAIDVKTREVIALDVSWLRNGAHAIWCIKDVLKKCKNEKQVVIITDGAGWYPWACKILHIKHKEVHGGKRNYVERFNLTFKDWVRPFRVNFRVRKGNVLMKVKQKISAWGGLWYNWNRYHETLGSVPCLS